MAVGVVFYFLLQLPWLIPAVVAPGATQPYGRFRNHCNETCGYVSIPYPFGIRSGCYAYNNSWFRLTCNETANGQKPFISHINLELVDSYWADENPVVVVNNPVIYLNCGNRRTNSPSSVDLQGSPFFFSSRFNQFGSVGCGNFVSVFPNNQTIPISSCLQRSCGDPASTFHGCHAIISENITSYTASVREVISAAGSQRCTSAFIFTSQRSILPPWHANSYGYGLQRSDSGIEFPDDISIDTSHVEAVLEWNLCDLEAVSCQELKQAENRRQLVQLPTLPLTYKYDCIERCGNIGIPFPFGIEVGCYINNWFRVTCNETIDGLRPFISSINLQLLDVAFPQGIAVVNNLLNYFNCSSLDQDTDFDLVGDVNLTGTPFLFSDLFNEFVSVGCGNLATFLRSPTDYPVGWCVQPLCRDLGTFEDRCYANVPPGLSSFAAKIVQISPTEGNNRSCGSVFIVDRRYAGSLETIIPFHDDTRNRTRAHFPATLVWGTQKRGLCELREGSDISCRSDGAYCWTNLSETHLCVCSSGSNPSDYSVDVCQESGKCLDLKYNYCHMFCLNAPGSNCSSSCPIGYEHILDSCMPIRPSTKTKSNSQTLQIIVGSSASIGTIFVLLGTWHLYRLVKKRNNTKLKQKYFKRNGGLLLQQQWSSNESNVEKIKLFTSKELEHATDYYNENRILGRGGQGIVYKGMLTDGSIVAIKKSKLVEEKILDERKLEQFINEVMILSQINHRNVVKLLGCCLETKVPLLVYEFVPNGTLYHLIHEPNEEFPLTWEMRLRIAIEIANALSYMHSAASIPIYHRDIKTSNILLDDKYKAKVSDFGTSRSVALEQTHVTTRVQGTFGYLDPEYFRSNQFTEKSDVYSFGVVLVELVTGQKPISSSQSEEVVRSLANFFLLSMKENSLLDIVDPLVQNGGTEEEIVAVAKLAKRCLNLNGKKRPTMKQVALELEWIRSSEEANVIQQSADEDSDTDDMFEVSGIISCSATGSVLKDSVTLSIDA
ncbi:hypothetical protein V6N13_047256 [Hibiscus sabdariffa]|uniref:Protein kinase domain-containing protein n=1 Tax=Hibiscus sabdariffa TaxID=183260 RepID=A0ABR2F3J9_9ROSI